MRNNESQYYTQQRLDNARVEDGRLILEARREPYRQGGDEAEYTSASITTQDQKHFQYGRIEVRAKLPRGRGMWPAIWMLGENIPEAGWPRCGEIDVMEYVGFEPHTIHANIHTQKYNHTRGTGKGDRIELREPWSDFHVYAVEWDEQRIDFFVDD